MALPISPEVNFPVHQLSVLARELPRTVTHERLKPFGVNFPVRLCK